MAFPRFFDNVAVVAPPMGASVSALPDDAKKTTVGSDTYYVYTDTWYKPFYSGSDVVYMVVGEPDGATG